MKKNCEHHYNKIRRKNIFMMKIFTIDAPHNQMHNVHI
jgi:hypothetical protein